MQHTTLTVGRVTYFLDAPTTRQETENAILDAVSRGGDYVALQLAGSKTLELLVSPGMSFRIGTGEIADDEEDAA